jgi:hypothetical protein
MTNNFLMPMANSRDAPRFFPDPSGFETFFEDVEELADRGNLAEAAKIKWAIRYAGTHADAWKNVACLADIAKPPTFAQFKADVLLCYPNISPSRRYTIQDLEQLVIRTSRFDAINREDFGEYYRLFITYSTYLMGKNRLTTRERDGYYLRGLPLSMQSAVLHRLSIKKPDVLPDDGYEFCDLYEASLFVLNAGGSLSGTRDSISKVVPKVEQTSNNGVGELIQAMSELTRVFTASFQKQSTLQSQPRSRSPTPSYPSGPAPGGAALNSPRRSMDRGDRNQSDDCHFCSSTAHKIQFCPLADEFIRQKKVIRNEYGRVVLPDGSYVPNYIKGRNLSERVTSWWLGKPSDFDQVETIAANFLEGPDECIFQLDIDPVSEPPTSAYLTEDDPLYEAACIQAQIDALRGAHVLALEKGKKKLQFDGVQILKRTGPPKPGNPIPPPSPNPLPSHGPTVYARPPHPRTQVPEYPSTATPNVAGKPGTRAGDQLRRPQGPMRPVDIPPKPAASDPQYRYQSAIESSVKASDIVDRALDATVTISTRELLATSSEVRRRVKDLLSGKKVSANLVESDQLDAYLDECYESSSPSVFLDLVKYDSSTAASSLPLRVIYPTFAPGFEPECILDGGAQVVVMRRDIWERLRAPIVEEQAMPMESANSSTSMTLGLVQNHPVTLGSITVYLQIQVVEEAPFEVLLGRPFFDIISCSEISTSGGGHKIRVTDPKTNAVFVFPTYPRVRKPPRTETEPSKRDFH